jgi:hypothetical protein
MIGKTTNSKHTCMIKALNKLIQKASLSSLLKLPGFTFPSCSTRDLLIVLQIYRTVFNNLVFLYMTPCTVLQFVLYIGVPSTIYYATPIQGVMKYTHKPHK